MKQVYLAGPQVFLPDAQAYFARAKQICKQYSLNAVCPFDGNPSEEIGLQKARWIFENNCRLIDASDLIIADLTQFRGALVDDGTSFEIGYAFHSGKTIYGFAKLLRPLLQMVPRKIATKPHASGYEIDQDGFLVNEDFGNSVNLMIEMAIYGSGGKLVEGNLEILLDRIRAEN
ncbi:nucleoside 2-deoxyribosyltransferase [Leptospira ryugenii]|uniref:Nucleoside 2-deoxyribosyltransferase n=1 Tax=Leptospira ryugenii TaxID=1917863 RepID=A0A2P2DXL2_9LEPT|nr:nucleoside 2-deoxyribosyltransferase [Leptospira ryugenii]GBF49375.1 nucleoside 2-deoxyribosyltransferase [Leptospira ryugenii]